MLIRPPLVVACDPSDVAAVAAEDSAPAWSDLAEPARKVPDVIGLPLADAVAELRDTGLGVDGSIVGKGPVALSVGDRS